MEVIGRGRKTLLLTSGLTHDEAGRVSSGVPTERCAAQASMLSSSS